MGKVHVNRPEPLHLEASPEPATLQHVQQQPSEPGQASAAQNWEQQDQQGAVHSEADVDSSGNNISGKIWLDDDVITLLPVMCATALQLAHAALTCVRLMRTKVFEGM
jgi:predicted DsbA family dithiol-disulfide isomerase